MKHAGTAFLVVMLFSTLGLWGLAQQKNGAYASRLRDLETRHVKFEDEQRALAQQAEASRRRIVQLEVEKADLTQAVDQLKVVLIERDELKQQVVARTQERDEASAQLIDRTKETKELRTQLTSRTRERDQVSHELKQLSTELQTLLGRVENVIASVPGANVIQATPTFRRVE